jgi:hypothetical protein
MGRGKFVGDFNMEGVSLLEILIWVTITEILLKVALNTINHQ